MVSPSEPKVGSLLTSIVIKIVLPFNTKLKLVSLQPLEKSEVSEASTAVMYVLCVFSIHLNHPAPWPRPPWGLRTVEQRERENHTGFCALSQSFASDCGSLVSSASTWDAENTLRTASGLSQFFTKYQDFQVNTAHPYSGISVGDYSWFLPPTSDCSSPPPGNTMQRLAVASGLSAFMMWAIMNDRKCVKPIGCQGIELATKTTKAWAWGAALPKIYTYFSTLERMWWAEVGNVLGKKIC